MKKELINVVIEKSIGNSFVIKMDGTFYDMITWKRASKLLECRPTIVDTIRNCPKNIDIPLRKELNDIEYDELTCIMVNWIDKKKSIQNIINDGNVSGAKVQVQSYIFSNSLRKIGFTELESPKIKYYLIIDGFDLEVRKPIFIRNMVNVEIVEKRAY